MSQLCYIGNSHTTEVLNTHTFVTRLYFSHNQAIKNASCTLTVCDWLTRYQSTGFMAVWQGCHTPNLKPLQPAATLEYIVRNPFLQEMMWSYAAFQIPYFLLIVCTAAAFTKNILYMQYAHNWGTLLHFVKTLCLDLSPSTSYSRSTSVHYTHTHTQKR